MKRLAHTLARLLGWSFHGIVPPVAKMVVLGAPHTSNWDFFVFLAALHHYRLRVRYLGKHTLFRPPLGWFFARLGGIPVDRSSPGGVVAMAVKAFSDAELMVLVIAPEGTRRAGRWWRSGFLNIAREARVPLVLAGIDYPTKTVTLGEAIDFDGDTADFMDAARAFYADKRGLRPELETPVRLRDELETS